LNNVLAKETLGKADYIRKNKNPREMKKQLLGKTLEQLQEVCKDLCLPSFAAKQIAQWIYQKREEDINNFTNLSVKAREILAGEYEVGFVSPIEVQTSQDGTKKYLFKYDSKSFVETVIIPSEDRITICVSTQVGCKMNCAFCATGHQGFVCDLSAGEILNLVMSVQESSQITNIVYMGMGEPMNNYDQVMQSLQILTSSWGLALSPRRITVSSSGLREGVKRFLKESDCHLAISLHSPFTEQRQTIMPVEKSNPVAQIIYDIKQCDWSGQRRVSFEYILWKDFNDSEEHAKSIADLLSGFECRVNLIRFHTIPGTPFKSASNAELIAFRDRLNAMGLLCTIRASKGEDILAACGLLSTKAITEEKSKNQDTQ
jgi:23S rRNA m2A2503 methyltransferase